MHCRDGKVFTLGTLPEENEYGSYQYGDIVVFSYNQDEEIQMIRYDRSSGQELDRVQVDGLAEKTSIKMIPRGFAAKPLS